MSAKEHRRVNRFADWHLLLFAVVFAAIGGYLIYRVLAAPNPNLGGDVNNDNVVNIVDLAILLSYYNKSNTTADLNGNNFTDITDLAIMLGNYNRRLNPPSAIPSGSVSVTGSGFVPATISIAANNQVTWTNNDTAPHQVAADPHPAHDSIIDFDSSIALQPGDSFSFPFETRGTFYLHDELNPNNSKYRLTVIVN